MKKAKELNVLSRVLCVALVIAIAFCQAACGSLQDDLSSDIQSAKEVSFVFTVTGPDGKETSFNISTTKTTVGKALLEEGLITGEEGAFGLYVKTVNGITCDYDTDGCYWAFYIDGTYAVKGVDKTYIESGKTYSFKAEK